MGKLSYPPEELEPWDVVTTKLKRKHKRIRKPTLARAIAQARKAGIEVARYEVDADGKIIIVPGKPDTAPTNTETGNEWDQVLQ